MLKKILIGILIVFILAGSAAFYAFKKLESQFESFMMAEVERQEAVISKNLKIKMETLALEAEKAAEIIDQRLASERATEVITTYFKDKRSGYPEARQVYIESLQTVPTIENKLVTEIDNKTNKTQINDTNKETKNELTSKESEAVLLVETTPEVVSAPVEVYTEEDFDRDKKIAMSLAMSRLTASQISRLIDISGGGFSPEERIEAKEMFYSNFTDEEQLWILDIYTKYYYLTREG